MEQLTTPSQLASGREQTEPEVQSSIVESGPTEMKPLFATLQYTRSLQVLSSTLYLLILVNIIHWHDEYD